MAPLIEEQRLIEERLQAERDEKQQRKFEEKA